MEGLFYLKTSKADTQHITRLKCFGRFPLQEKNPKYPK
jgi:hypothetical protein